MLADATTIIAIAALVLAFVEHGLLMRAEGRIEKLEMRAMREDAMRRSQPPRRGGR